MVVGIVDELLHVVRTGRLTVRIVSQTDPPALILEFLPPHQLRIDDPRATHILRMMCANVAVRATGDSARPESFFSGSGSIPDSDHRGWKAIWHNTPDRKMLELNWFGDHEVNGSAKGPSH